MVRSRGAAVGCPDSATPTDTVPGAATRAADTLAVSRVEETNVVLSASPFHVTCVAGVKFVPSIVSVKSGLPATTLVGTRPVIVIAGSTVNVSGDG